jgi:hypothetical protein
VEASGVEKVVFLKVTLKVCDPWFLLAWSTVTVSGFVMFRKLTLTGAAGGSTEPDATDQNLEEVVLWT